MKMDSKHRPDSKELPHIQYIDGLRGIAILLVLAVHTFDHTNIQFASPLFELTPTWLRAGARGVQLFFILSAFTLLKSGERRGKESVVFFYLRRAFRILPLWWTAVVAYGFLYGKSFSYLLPNLFFYSGFIRFRPVEMIMPQWSLFVEETFYLFLPLLLPLAVSVKRAGIFLVSLVVVQQIWSNLAPAWGVPSTYQFIDFFPFNQWFCFGIGFVWFTWTRRQDFSTFLKQRKIPVFLIDAGNLISLVVLVPMNHVAAAFAFFPLALTASVSGSCWGKLCRSRLLNLFGRSCYSIYLWQIGIFNLLYPLHTSLSQSLGLANLPMEVQFLIGFPLFAGISLAIGLLSWHFIERPAIALGKRVGEGHFRMPKLRLGKITSIAICFALLVVVANCHTWNDPDIWGHLYRGGLIRQTGQVSPTLGFDSSVMSSINHYWLFQIFISFLYQTLGAWGITALFTLVWGAIFGLLAQLVDVKRHGLAAWGWLLGAFLVCETRFFERPEAFGFLTLLFCLFLIRRADDRLAKGKSFAVTFWPLIVAQVMLANVHGYFALIPVVAFAKAVSSLVDKKGAERGTLASHYAGLGVALILVSGLTPFGFHPWFRVFLQSQEMSSVRLNIGEMQSFSLSALQHFSFAVYALFWLLTLLGFGAILFSGNTVSVFPLMLAVGALLISSTTLRMASFLFFLSAPLWSQLLDAFSERIKKPVAPRILKLANRAFAFLLLCFAFGFYHGDYYKRRDIVKEFGTGPHRGEPKQLSEYLKANPPQGAILNGMGEGSYLKFHDPRLSLFSDSVINGTSKVEEYFAALTNMSAFQSFQNRFQFAHVIITPEANSELFTGLLRSGDWKLAYADLHFALLSKRNMNSSDENFRIYRGEDLTDHYHGRSASLWSKLLVDTDRVDLLKIYFQELTRAPAIPSPVLDFGLDYFRHHADSNLAELVLRLRPNLFSVRPGDLAEIDQRLRAISNRIL